MPRAAGQVHLRAEQAEPVLNGAPRNGIAKNPLHVPYLCKRCGAKLIVLTYRRSVSKAEPTGKANFLGSALRHLQSRWRRLALGAWLDGMIRPDRYPITSVAHVAG